MRPLLLAPLLALFACSVEAPGTQRRTVAPDALPAWITVAERAVDARRAYVLELPDRMIVLDLAPNERLFGAEYSEVRLDAQGQALPRPTTDLASFEPCWFQGTAEDPATGERGIAAVRTCDGEGDDRLSGLITLDGVMWDIAPERPEDGLHRLVPTPPLDLDEDSPWAAHGGHALPVTLPEGGQLPPPPSTTWVELLVTNDAARFGALGANTETNAADIANITDALFANGGFSPAIRVTLVAQVTLTADPFTPVLVGSETDSADLLDDFQLWAGTAGLPHHDNRQLYTHRDLDGANIGLAALQGMCVPSWSGALVQTTFSPAHNAAIAAHEMGHNLDARHDGGGAAAACAPSGTLMSPGTCTNCPAPASWSDCSRASVDAFQAAGFTTCLDDLPATSWSPSCGNGLVEAGEACDCGGPDCTLDPCCDGATCELSVGATCSADDACCDASTCEPAAAGATCRAGDDLCDTAEVCDGASAACPADVGADLGTECVDPTHGSGACWEGRCVSYERDCAEILPGNAFHDTGTCDGPIAADPCGQLFCGDAHPQNCYGFVLADSSPMLVPDGTPCGPADQCFEGLCSPSTVLAGTADLCPADPGKLTPGLCGCGESDADTDLDGSPDCMDACPNDPALTVAGTCGCGQVSTDTDGDGSADCHDACPTDGQKLTPGACGCGVPDLDGDADGIMDCVDGCPTHAGNDCPPPPEADDGCGCGGCGSRVGGFGGLAVLPLALLGLRARRR